MALPDPSFLPRLNVVRETREFSDPMFVDAGGTPFVWRMTFEAQEGFAQHLLLNETFDNLVADYLGAGAKPVSTGDGQMVSVSERLCDRIALMMTFDKSEPEPGEMRYDFARWAILADRANPVFLQIMEFALEIRQKAWGQSPTGEADLKNESAANGESTCEPQPPKPDSTPTS